MDCALVNGTGNDLHGIGMRAVTADDLDFLVSGQQHLVPLEHRLIGQRVGVVAIEIEHHLGDAAFGRLHIRSLDAEAELGAHRGLDAVAVQNLAFDLRGLDRFLADKLDLQGFLVVGPDMLAGTDDLPD
jgi:hypothetical protein